MNENKNKIMEDSYMSIQHPILTSLEKKLLIESIFLINNNYKNIIIFMMFLDLIKKKYLSLISNYQNKSQN